MIWEPGYHLLFTIFWFWYLSVNSHLVIKKLFTIFVLVIVTCLVLAFGYWKNSHNLHKSQFSESMSLPSSLISLYCNYDLNSSLHQRVASLWHLLLIINKSSLLFSNGFSNGNSTRTSIPSLNCCGSCLHHLYVNCQLVTVNKNFLFAHVLALTEEYIHLCISYLLMMS